jgi:hypothetical protein
VKPTNKDERVAQGFNYQSKAHALDAEIFRDEHEGRFHLTIYNLTEDRLSQVLECVESSARS